MTLIWSTSSKSLKNIQSVNVNESSKLEKFGYYIWMDTICYTTLKTFCPSLFSSVFPSMEALFSFCWKRKEKKDLIFFFFFFCLFHLCKRDNYKGFGCFFLPFGKKSSCKSFQILPFVDARAFRFFLFYLFFNSRFEESITLVWYQNEQFMFQFYNIGFDSPLFSSLFSSGSFFFLESMSSVLKRTGRQRQRYEDNMRLVSG